MSKVEGKMSELEDSKTSFTAFTIFFLYYLLIFKNIFFPRPSSRVQKAPGIFLVFSFTPIRSSPPLKSRVPPAPLGVHHYVKFEERIKSRAKKKSAKLNISHENKTVLK